MQFCDKLVALRRTHGYSQEQLADLLGISRQSVSKWESGASSPELPKLVAIADVFGVSIDYLVRDGAARESDQIDSHEVLRELGELKQAIRRQHIYEYRSRTKIFGVPLVHVKFSRYGFGGVARGIVAIGNVAVGVIGVGGITLSLIGFGGIAISLLLALGGIAFGGIAFGGVAVGLLALGGVAIGLYCVGGCAVAGELAIGGVASGRVAVGELASGRFALGSPSSAGQIRQFLLTHYPGMWEWVLRFLAAFF